MKPSLPENQLISNLVPNEFMRQDENIEAFRQVNDENSKNINFRSGPINKFDLRQI